MTSPGGEDRIGAAQRANDRSVVAGADRVRRRAELSNVRCAERKQVHDVKDAEPPTPRRTGSLVNALRHSATCVALAGDETVATAGALSGAVWVWTLDPIGLRHTLDAHRGRVTAVAFDAGAARLASGGGSDRLARVWRVEDGAPGPSFGPHLGPVAGLAFCRGGRWLAVQAGGEVTLWEIATGRRIAALPGPPAGKPGGIAAPTDDLLVVVGQAETVVWDLVEVERFARASVESLIDDVRARTGLELRGGSVERVRRGDLVPLDVRATPLGGGR